MHNEVFLCDCMDYMKSVPDKFFDIAIVDPPYGINVNHNIGRRKNDRNCDYKKVKWDSSVPKDEYFDELFRISKNQVIWGGNYFKMPPTKCFLVWRKPQINENVSFSMVEYAWCSFDKTAKEYVGIQTDPYRIHPTQKPIELYKWILNLFANQGDKIFDSFVGSGSIRIACYDMGFDFTGCEIDKEYFDLQEERFKIHTSQLALF